MATLLKRSSICLYKNYLLTSLRCHSQRSFTKLVQSGQLQRIHLKRNQKLLNYEGAIVFSQSRLFNSLKIDSAVTFEPKQSTTTMSQEVANEMGQKAATTTTTTTTTATSTTEAVDAQVASSTSTLSSTESFVDPNVIDLSGSAGTNLIDLTTQTLSQLDLASNWTPVGWVMHYLDFLHTYLPWWGSIAVATLTFRILMFPIVIKAQKNAVKMNALMPDLQNFQVQMNNARLSGNQMDSAKFQMKLQELYKKHDINPWKSMLVPMAQAPVFMSFFICLRRMSNLPVESLKVGGLFWFTDLTISDPYYILPLITCASLWTALEYGVESGVSAQHNLINKFMIRFMPLIMFPFICNFSASILTYWCTSNIISLIQVVILKQEPIRKFFNIPKMIKHDPTKLPLHSKGFVQGFKESMELAKVTKQIAERQRIDEINFRKAAIGPIKRTYSYDPTKVEAKKT